MISSNCRSQRPSVRPSEQIRKRSPGWQGRAPGVDDLVPRPEGLVEGVLAGMAAGLSLVDPTVAAQPAHVAMIVGQLDDAFIGRQVVDATVPDVAKIKPARRDPAEAERGAHAAALLVGFTQAQQIGVNGPEEFAQNAVVAAVGTRCGGPVAARHELGQPVHGEAAGEFTGIGAAHAIAHREHEVGLGPAGFTGLAQVVDFPAVKGQGQKGVFIVRADMAAMGQARPAQGG